ncbi:hypothetical protein O3M35_003878 [Rhynocoris fuscipes]|uniref:Uncharacterized protein n=1 Tax=Rhynocoris fuscipes TaxID=488301 RepID=A0AAW1CHW0_9HEMI
MLLSKSLLDLKKVLKGKQDIVTILLLSIMLDGLWMSGSIDLGHLQLGKIILFQSSCLF